MEVSISGWPVIRNLGKWPKLGRSDFSTENECGAHRQTPLGGVVCGMGIS